MGKGKNSNQQQLLRYGLGVGLALVLVVVLALGLRFGLAQEKPGIRFKQGNPAPFSYFYEELKRTVRDEALTNASKQLGITTEELAAVISDTSYASLLKESVNIYQADQRSSILKEVKAYFNGLENKLLEAHIDALVHEQSANNIVSDAPSDWLVELNQLEDTLFKGKQSMQKRLVSMLKPMATINKKGYLMNKQPTMIDDPNKCKLTLGGFQGPLSLGFASQRMPETAPVTEFHQEFEGNFSFSAIYDHLLAELASHLGELSIVSSQPGNRFSPAYSTDKQLRLSDEGKAVGELTESAFREDLEKEEALTRARYQTQKELEVLVVKATKERLGLELENFLGSVERIEKAAAQMEEVATQRLQTIAQC